MQRITSRQNPIVGRYRAAARGDSPGVLLLDGAHLVAEAVRARLRIREVAVASGALDRADLRPTLDALSRSEVETFVVSASVIAALSPVRSASPIVALADRPDPDREQQRSISGDGRLESAGSGRSESVLLDVIAVDVQDPGNLGALIRVAEAGGATRVVVTGKSADPFGWKALRGSMGSALRFPVLVIQDPLQAISAERAHACHIVATAPRGGESIFEVNLTRPTAVLVGSEGQGLPPDLIQAADDCVTIPMEPPVESLNAAVTAALITYEARRQRAAVRDRSGNTIAVSR